MYRVPLWFPGSGVQAQLRAITSPGSRTFCLHDGLILSRGDRNTRMMSSTAEALTATRVAAAEDAARWVAEAARGDEDAILALLTRWRPPLVRVLTGVVGNPTWAEDLAQEAFLVAVSRLTDLRRPEQFYPWVRRIGLRLALRALRSHRAAVPLSAAEGECVAGPEDQVETRLAILAVLRQLSPPLRTALVLREMEGMDYREIAAELQLPVGTVRSRLSAAREQFRALWETRENES